MLSTALVSCINKLAEFCAVRLEEDKIQTEAISWSTISVIIQICKYPILADACVDEWWSVFICLDTDVFVYWIVNLYIKGKI